LSAAGWAAKIVIAEYIRMMIGIESMAMGYIDLLAVAGVDG
jgi:hypothetical protein